MLRHDLPQDLQIVFISAVTGMGLDELKDILWQELNSESNKIKGVIAEDTLVHRDKDMSYLAAEVYDEDRLADEEIGLIYEDDQDDEEEEGDELAPTLSDKDRGTTKSKGDDEIEELEDFEYI